MRRYDFRELIARAQELRAQATEAGLPRYAIAVLILADRIQLVAENAVQTLATLAMRSEERSALGGAA